MLPALLAVAEMKSVVSRISGRAAEILKSGGIPLGVTKDDSGKEVMYYKGSQLPPAYLSDIDTLIGDPFEEWFEERIVGVEYFYTLPFDTETKAGFLQMDDGQKCYYTSHQPTCYSTSKDDFLKRIWFRKIEITLSNGVMSSCWEKYIKV